MRQWQRGKGALTGVSGVRGRPVGTTIVSSSRVHVSPSPFRLLGPVRPARCIHSVVLQCCVGGGVPGTWVGCHCSSGWCGNFGWGVGRHDSKHIQLLAPTAYPHTRPTPTHAHPHTHIHIHTSTLVEMDQEKGCGIVTEQRYVGRTKGWREGALGVGGGGGGLSRGATSDATSRASVPLPTYPRTL